MLLLPKMAEGEVMRKFFVDLLRGWAKGLEKEEKIIAQAEELPEEEHLILPDKIAKAKNPSKNIKPLSINPRDILETMEFPFLALSKKRIKPIIYESPDGRSKIKISAHREHYVASIYDWDIVLFVASKMQEIINVGSDIPPRTLIVPRHELLKAIHKHNVGTTKKEIEASLSRLTSTLIETTIRNEDYRYKGGFGFLDSWGYTERKDIKEFQITLSQWLYDGICRKGSLLKVDQRYFNITSGLKKFLYRTARKHVGTRNKGWKLSLETLYQKSGSEQELRNFKHDLKRAVADDDIPGYSMNWIEENGNTFVYFINKKESLKEMLL